MPQPYPEVFQTFQESFALPLAVDGLIHQFVFADGLTVNITVLWIKDVTSYLAQHSHGFNSVVMVGDRMFMAQQSDVPANAAFYANDYLTIDGGRMKIIQARLRDALWTVQLRSIQTRDNAPGWT